MALVVVVVVQVITAVVVVVEVLLAIQQHPTATTTTLTWGGAAQQALPGVVGVVSSLVRPVAAQIALEYGYYHLLLIRRISSFRKPPKQARVFVMHSVRRIVAVVVIRIVREHRPLQEGVEGGEARARRLLLLLQQIDLPVLVRRLLQSEEQQVRLAGEEGDVQQGEKMERIRRSGVIAVVVVVVARLILIVVKEVARKFSHVLETGKETPTLAAVVLRLV